jgi:hypothetical protein
MLEVVSLATHRMKDKMKKEKPEFINGEDII